MKQDIEIWITVDCAQPIKNVLVNRGIAMGNEFRFEAVAWKIIVTRTADLFMEVLKRATEHRLAEACEDVQPAWRMALGKDELLIVPPGENRQAAMPFIRQTMEFLRGLLYERKFVGTALRAVLGSIIDARAEERVLAGKHDPQAIAEAVVTQLNAMDLAKEGVGAEQDRAAAAGAPAAQPAAAEPPAEAPAADEADTKTPDDDKKAKGKGKGKKSGKE